MNTDIFDWLSLFIAIGALIFSMLQFFCERNRNRKEATIHAFDELENNDVIKKLFSLSKSKIDNYVMCRIEHDRRIDKEWEEISIALSLIEHYSVGINNGIYDLSVLNAMAGNKIINLFYSCEKLIQHKRRGVGNEKNYSEFESMVNCLIKHRNKKKQSLPEKI